MIDFDKYTRFHVVDTETADKQPFEDGGGVCELSIREVCPHTLETTKEWHAKLNPEGRIKPGAAAIHGITNAQVADAPTMEEYLSQDDPWAPNAEPIVFLAYNAPFDFAFLKRYIGCEVVVADVLILAREYIKPEDFPELGIENHQMQTLRFAFELDEMLEGEDFDAHSAAGDTRVLVKVIELLMTLTGKTLPELCSDAVRLTNAPVTEFKFGKHKGKTVEAVCRSNPDYLVWSLNNMNNMQIGLRNEMIRCLRIALETRPNLRENIKQGIIAILEAEDK